jgi:hypothetical protein
MTEETQIQPKQRAVRVREVTLENGQQAYEYSDGTVRNWHGHPVPGTKIPNTGYEITHENARELLARRRAIGLRAQLRGLAKAEGVDPSEIDDELLMQAGSAVEALTLHMAQTFQKSSSLRGMAEVYGVLSAPLVGDRRQKDEGDHEPNEQPTIILMLMQYINQLSAPPAGAIDAEFKE